MWDLAEFYGRMYIQGTLIFELLYHQIVYYFLFVISVVFSSTSTIHIMHATSEISIQKGTYKGGLYLEMLSLKFSLK